MKFKIKPIEHIVAGDVFYEYVSGHMLRHVALESVSEDEEGFTVKAVSPLGNRHFFQPKEGAKVRLYYDTPVLAPQL